MLSTDMQIFIQYSIICKFMLSVIDYYVLLISLNCVGHNYYETPIHYLLHYIGT